MRKRFLVRRSIAVVAVSVWMVTCGDPKTRAPLAPSGPSVQTREISGPGLIAPGQSAQFTATVHLGDGTTKLLTSVVWHSTNTSVLQVTSAGLAVAGSGVGDVTLQADVPSGGGTVRLSREVVIVPDGTYRLVGTVRDGEFASNSISGARLDVTPGSASATTDFGGNYKLYGVPADATVHIAKDGYQPFEQSVHLAGNATQSFLLTPTNPHLRLGGAYTVAIDAAPGCSGPGSLPEDLQHRSYQATVTQTGLTLQVILTEARFKIQSGSGNRFFGVAGIGGATFSLNFGGSYYYYYYYPDVVERLSNGTVLLVAGSVTTTGTAAGLSGQLNGELSNYPGTFPNGALLGTCSSKSHQFTLTPR
jgi:hypothetical protein